jgi:hypothetical protein
MEMAETRQFWLDKAGRINQNCSNGQRKPHKVLLLLVAIRQWQAGVKSLPFEQVDRELNDSLKAYAPPIKTRHQPEGGTASRDWVECFVVRHCLCSLAITAIV